MAKLPEKPLLKDFQQYVRDICNERAWNKNSDTELFLLFAEEVGELAKAIRNTKKLFTEEAKKDKQPELEDEFADVFSYLLDLANFFDIDLEQAFRNKEEKNSKRYWS